MSSSWVESKTGAAVGLVVETVSEYAMGKGAIDRFEIAVPEACIRL